MYSIKFTNGDIDLSDRRGVVITGREKLIQQLTNWLTEAYGVDRFHPAYGSKLQSMVGAANTDAFLRELEDEVRRTIEKYMQIQAEGLSANPQLYDKDEVIYQILSVSASYESISSVSISIFVQTLSGANVEVSTGVLS
jgi:phage baseplate assembly protein W